MKEQKEKFYLLNDEPECTNVIFWYSCIIKVPILGNLLSDIKPEYNRYVPERLRPRQCPQYGTRDWQLELGNVSCSAPPHSF